jgi:hypothetical protein
MLKIVCISLVLFGLYANDVHIDMRCKDVYEDDDFCGVLTEERGGSQRSNYYHNTKLKDMEIRTVRILVSLMF